MATTSLTVSVRVKPGASRTKVGGVHDGPFGPALIVAVQERAVEGKATEAVRAALAKALNVPVRQVQLRTGAASRDKLFTVDNPPDQLAERIAELRGGTT